MNKKILLFFVVLLVFCSSANLLAETLYSLNDLCKIADKNALKIKISEDDLYISKQEKKRALSRLMPSLTIIGSKKRAFIESNEQISSVEMNNTQNTETLGLELGQSFTLNGKELIAVKIKKDGIEKSEFDLEAIKSDYMFEISKVYYSILCAEKNLEISEADVNRLGKHRNSVYEKLQVGTVTKAALFRAEAELSKAKTNLLRADNNFKFFKASLKSLVDIDEDFSLIKEQSFNFKDFNISFDELVQEAIANRPELKSVEKTLNVAEKTIKYEHSPYWPKISIKGTYRDSEIISDYESKFKDHDYETNNTEKSIEATLSFIIFDGGLRKAQINQAVARKRQAKSAILETKKQIILESKKAWFEYETVKSTIKTLNDELKSAKENLDAVTMQFEYGLSDSVDMMDADTLLVSAELKLTEAEYNYTLLVLDMIRIKGGLLKLLL